MFLISVDYFLKMCFHFDMKPSSCVDKCKKNNNKTSDPVEPLSV